MEKETVKQKKNYLKEKGSLITYSKLFWLFLAGSVVGVIMEGTFCLFTKGQWESHVISVCLPFNALYGAGAALFYVGAVKLRKKNIWIRVLYMTVAATVLELLCGLLLKYGLGMRAWNYENSFLNYKGIICLGFSIAWGIAAFGFCKLYSHINSLLNKLRGRYWNCACAVLSIVMAIDISLAGISIVRWSERHYGISAPTQFEQEVDIEAPDELMESRFVEWRFLG